MLNRNPRRGAGREAESPCRETQSHLGGCQMHNAGGRWALPGNHRGIHHEMHNHDYDG